MILADKIIRLRKKNGWSQEELAEKMNVSRQAVSKWESAQTIPDLDKILRLGELFGVTTDYLLKDNMENEEFTEDISISGIKRISLKDANSYIEHRKWASVLISTATFLCILSPIPLLILAAGVESGLFNISENMAAGIGLVVLFLIVITAVPMFVYCVFKNAPYKYIEGTEPFELEYGVSGMVKEKQKAFRDKYMMRNIIATCICILSPVPLICGSFTENEFLMVVLLGVTMIIAGIGTSIFIINGVRMASMRKLLKEGEYSIREKKKSAVKETVGIVYWLVLTAVYLILSFVTAAWDKTWLLFAGGGIIFAALMTIMNLLAYRDTNKDNGKDK